MHLCVMKLPFNSITKGQFSDDDDDDNYIIIIVIIIIISSSSSSSIGLVKIRIPS